MREETTKERTGPASGEPGGLPRQSSSRSFRILMSGSSISMLGTRISTVAFPMLVLHLYNSPLITGLVAFAAIAPSMLFYIPAGVLVDRWNPRRVMFFSESMRGLTIASVLAVLLLCKMHVYIWFLILAMVAEEILEIFSTLADRRYLNRLIDPVDPDEAILSQASVEVRTHAAVVAGRPIGPFLFSVTPLLPFLADAVSFLASVISLFFLRKTDQPQPEPGRLVLREVLYEVGQGFKWLKGDRRALLTIALMAMTSMVAQALILMFLVEAHSRQLSTVSIGVVLAASGVGGAVGSFCTRFVPSSIRILWLPIQMIAWSVALTFLALAGGQSVYWSAGTMFILGLTGAVGNVEFGTYLLRKVADGMIAKITGIGQMLAIGACALGPVLSGYAVQHFHVRGAIYILLGIVLFLAFMSLFMPEASQRVGGFIRMISDPGSWRNWGSWRAVFVGSAADSSRAEYSRLSSRTDDKALTCGDNRLCFPVQVIHGPARRCRHRIREESGGFRKHWNPWAWQA